MAKQNELKTPPMYSEDFKVEETVEITDKDLEIPLYETEEVPENESLVMEKQQIIQKYSAADAVIAKLEARLSLTKVEDETSYKLVYNTHQLIKKWYRFVEQVRKKGKEPLLEMGRTYDAEAKRIEELLDKVDNKCLELRKPWEDKKEADRLEKIKLEQETLNSRIAQMQGFGMVLNGNSWTFKDIVIDATDLRSMAENVWSLVLKQIEEEFTKDKAEKEAEAELKRKEEEERQRELDELKAKNEAFEREREEREKKEELERLEKIEREQKIEEERKQMEEERFQLRLERLAAIGIEFNKGFGIFVFEDSNICTKAEVINYTAEQFNAILPEAKALVEASKLREETRKKQEQEELAKQAKLEEEEKAKKEEEAQREKFLKNIGCEIDKSNNWVYNTKLETKGLICLPLYVASEDVLKYSVDGFNELISKVTVEIENYENEIAEKVKEHEIELEKNNKINSIDRAVIKDYFERVIDFINLDSPKDLNSGIVAEELGVDIKSVTDLLSSLVKKYND